MDEKITPSDRVALWVSLLIPGIITALVDFDISIFVTYAVVASLLGAKAVWLLILVYAILHILNSVSGRIVIVADRGLIELIREHFGLVVSLLVFLTIGILDFLTVLQSFLAVHYVADLLHVSFLLFAAIFLFYLLLIFIFKIQKFASRIFVLIALFYTSVLINAAANILPIMHNITASRLSLTDFFRNNTDLYFLALLGATASAWNQFLITRYTYRTKLDLDKLDYHALDNRTSTSVTFFFAGLFVSTMAILFPGGSLIGNPQSLTSFVPLSEPVVRLYFFAFGLLFIALTNIYAVSLSLSHAFTEFFGIDRSNEQQGKFSMSHTIIMLALSIPAILVVQLTGIELFPTAVTFGFIQSLFIFLFIYFLYRLANNHSLMGRYRNDWLHNASLAAIAVFLLAIIAEVLGKAVFRL